MPRLTVSLRIVVVLSAAAVVTAARAGASEHPPVHANRGVTAVTISAAPDPASPAAAVVISGTVAGPERAGALVTVWRMLPREARFHVALSAITDARGRYAVILPPAAVMTNAQWYASAGGVRSEPASQSVTALISLRPSTTLVAPGDRIVLSGHVTPSHGGNRILIEQLRRNRWSVIATRALNGGSNFAYARRFTAGEVRLRAVLPSNPRNAESDRRP